MAQRRVLPAPVTALALAAVRGPPVLVDKLQRRVEEVNTDLAEQALFGSGVGFLLVLLEVLGREGLVVWAVQGEGEDLREGTCRRCCPGFLRGPWLI